MNPRLEKQKEETQQEYEDRMVQIKAEEEAEEKKGKLEVEIKNQRGFYNSLISRLKDGEITPKEALEFEFVERKDSKKVAEMTREEHILWTEKNAFANQLSLVRKAKQKEEVGDKIATDILLKRENLQSKLAQMTPKEQQEYTRRMNRIQNQ